MLPAARQGDHHVCPAHGVSPVDPPCCLEVYIENVPAARKGDGATCPTGPDLILDGSPTVLIGNRPAARITEKFAHGGTVISGATTVLIGNPAIGPDGMAIQIPPACAFLKDFGRAATGRTLHRLRDSYSMSQPTTQTKQPQDDQPAGQFLARTVVIRGHTVTVYEPSAGVAPPQWIPSSDSVAQGLATLSDEQLRNVKEVYVVPHGSGGSPSAIADYSKGRIRYFPRSPPVPQSDIDWALQHEGGHAYSMSEVWKNDPAARDAWIRAIGADHRQVTAYGDSSEYEDFSELMVLFATVFGTPCEAAAKALFPNRWAIMQRLLPNGLPVRNPTYTSRRY